jgi:hypothetical protein
MASNAARDEEAAIRRRLLEAYDLIIDLRAQLANLISEARGDGSYAASLRVMIGAAEKELLEAQKAAHDADVATALLPAAPVDASQKAMLGHWAKLADLSSTVSYAHSVALERQVWSLRRSPSSALEREVEARDQPAAYGADPLEADVLAYDQETRTSPSRRARVAREWQRRELARLDEQVRSDPKRQETERVKIHKEWTRQKVRAFDMKKRREGLTAQDEKAIRNAWVKSASRVFWDEAGQEQREALARIALDVIIRRRAVELAADLTKDELGSRRVYQRAIDRLATDEVRARIRAEVLTEVWPQALREAAELLTGDMREGLAAEVGPSTAGPETSNADPKEPDDETDS